MSNPFAASIVETQQQGDTTFFTISIRKLSSGASWEVIKRYSQFAQLRKSLKSDNVNVPKSFPRKHLTGNNNLSVVNQRRTEFEEFVNEVVLAHWTHPAVAEWLDLERQGRCERILSPSSSDVCASEHVQISQADFKRLCEQLRNGKLTGLSAEQALLDAAAATAPSEALFSPISSSPDASNSSSFLSESLTMTGTSRTVTGNAMSRTDSREMLLPRHHLHNLQADAEMTGLKHLNNELLKQLQQCQNELQQVRSADSRLHVSTTPPQLQDLPYLPPPSPMLLQPSPVIESARPEPAVGAIPNLSI